MAVPVIGIDFGNENCFIAAARSGGLEVLANDYSLRDTPSCVAFHGKSRLMGTGAKSQMITNLRNTFYSFKRLLGRPFEDPVVQEELKFITYNVQRSQTGGVAISGDLAGEQEIFTIEQVAAMLFTKLKEIACSALATKIADCVITVPTFATDAERRALLSAAKIAGLNVLRLLNESAAVALCYGLYKQELPAPEQPPRRVVFVDFGQSALQASLCHFNKGSLKMIGYAFDSQLGGRNFDSIIAEHLVGEFKTKYRIDAKSNKRAMLRLLTESEKLKKNMSANSTQLPLNIECFMDEKDVSGSMKRADFEEMCAPLFQRVEAVFRQLLESTGTNPKDIDEVEIVGGSTRIPAVKTLIQNVFEKQPCTTLNQDEAVCRGAALQAAMLSPSFKVREFNITDLQPYPIMLQWQDPSGLDNGEMELFTRFNPVPFTKMLTLKRKEPFIIRASYNGPVPYPIREIGDFLIKEVRPSPTHEAQKIKIKIKVNTHGIFTVSTAILHEQTEAEAMETEQTNGPESEKNSTEQQQSQEEQKMEMEAKTEEGKKTEDGKKTEEGKKMDEGKKMVVKTTELPIESRTHGYSDAVVDQYAETEAQLIASDRQERERQDSKNSLEEYIYDARNRASDETDLEPYLKPNDRQRLLSKLEEMENWLYEDGEDCQKSVYVQKIEDLRKLGDPPKDRKREYELRPKVIEELCAGLQKARKFVDSFASGDDKYSHIDAAEVQKLEKALQEKQIWLDQKMGAVTRLAKTDDIPAELRSSVFTAETQVCNKRNLASIQKFKILYQCMHIPTRPVGENSFFPMCLVHSPPQCD
ncbi:hypothetical protein QYM36_003639, partial [Artemia franciscana]